MAQGTEARGYRVVSLVNAALSAAALKAVLAFAYTERVDIAMADVDAFLRVARRCRLHALVRDLYDGCTCSGCLLAW
jgi:hypothetical protein